MIFVERIVGAVQTADEYFQTDSLSHLKINSPHMADIFSNKFYCVIFITTA